MEGDLSQLKRGFVLVIVVILIGTGGYYLLGHEKWSLLDCLYMTIITVCTVGYGEVIPVDTVHFGRLFTILLIVFGTGSMVFFGSAIVALFVERDIGQLWRKKKMEKQIASISNHVIVCGAGTVGRQVITELIVTKTPFIVIEKNEKRIEELKKLLKMHDLLYVTGDATDDDVLREAQIERARGVAIVLPSDKDSLIVTVTARQLNKDIRIVARCHEPDNMQRILKAGASSVVSPNVIGGMRIVSEMIRPQVVEFLDLMLRDKDKNLRIEEALIPDNSNLIGKTLQDTWIRKITNLLVLAIKHPTTLKYIYNPGPDTVIEKGTILILLGTTDEVIKFRQALEESSK